MHVHIIPKEKHNYIIITLKGLHQYPTDELTTHRVAGDRFCQRKIHPNKLLEL
jgi:hypothetical protein